MSLFPAVGFQAYHPPFPVFPDTPPQNERERSTSAAANFDAPRALNARQISWNASVPAANLGQRPAALSAVIENDDIWRGVKDFFCKYYKEIAICISTPFITQLFCNIIYTAIPATQIIPYIANGIMALSLLIPAETKDKIIARMFSSEDADYIRVYISKINIFAACSSTISTHMSVPSILMTFLFFTLSCGRTVEEMVVKLFA